MDNLASTDMLIDGYDQFNQQENDVVNISPDDDASDAQTEVQPRADDFEAMKAQVLIDLPDTEAEAETFHTWHIKNWRGMAKKEHGPIFECGGSPWRVLFFPYGNQVDSVSFYLEHGYEGDPPEDWYACVQFALVLWNPHDPTIYRAHTATHRFNAKEADWGFTRFVELRKAFHQPWEGTKKYLVENDEAQLTAYVRIIKDPTGVLWHNFEGYDSKKETGMVGLKNQGATCYLNSLLQSLYFTDAFRRAVYQIPTEGEIVRTNNVLALQRLFYRLQKDKLAISTNELTASFGWDTRQIFEQQDVQELSRILMEKLEERMKGTTAEKALPELFVGKSKTYISCINVDFESSRIEEFWDLQLNVRGNKTLHESFMDYIQVETLEGDNKYDAGEPYKLQDARKGVIFESFPPVLHLQLKRFEYDIERDAMMKVNDRHEFPEEFDAAPYLSQDADMSEPWIYQLHSVLVHSGDLSAGHYYAFLRPTKDGPFYKFDDDRVTRATMKEALEENYGGEYPNIPNGGLGQRQPYMRGYSTKRSMNAYMLVYLRKSRVGHILTDVEEEDIPAHIEKKIEEEQAELAKRKKEREEAHLYLNIGIITQKTFQQHHGFDLVSYENDIDDPATARPYRILRTTKIGELAAAVAKDLELEADQVRFWVMVGRQNKTTRPDQPIKDPNMSVEEAWSRYSSKGKPFHFWAESAPKENGKVEWPDTAQATSINPPILIFLKYFDVLNQTLTGVSHLYVRKHDKVESIAPMINVVMGWESTTQIMLFEEIKFSMVDYMKPKQTYAQSEIQDGDIICFQKNIPDLDPTSVTYNDARQYYDYLLNRIPVAFYPRPGTEGDSFTLNLSKKMTYEQFSGKVGEHVGADPTHIRFATVHATTGKPKAWVKRNLNQNLSQVLQSTFTSYAGYSQQRSDALYYEVLETSLADYETKKIMKVTWLPEGLTKEEPLEILVPRAGLVEDLAAGIIRKANLPEDKAKNLRIFEVQGGKIARELLSDIAVNTIAESTILFAELIPEEELNASEEDKFVYAFHFDKEPNKPHGVPFKFIVKPKEQLKDAKERISKRTGIKGKLLQQIKFAAVPRGSYVKPTYIEDDDVLLDAFTDSDDSLGLDHVNKARNFWNKSESMFIK